MKKIVAILFLSVLIAYAAYTVATSPTFADFGVEKGDLAYDFELEDMEGNIVKLSDFKGKKVMVNFWTSWCPPCEEEFPAMIEFYSEYEDDVEILAVNITKFERNFTDVETFHEKYQIPFSVLLDRDETVSSQFQVITIPTTYFIDSRGMIGAKISGPMTKEFMSETIEKLK